MAEDMLYDQQVLDELVLPQPLADSYRVRPLQSGDYHRGHVALLAQLTSVGNISESMYAQQFERMKSSGEYYVTVIEDVKHNRLVACATLLLEYKFIHQCAMRGRIEDVVVDSSCRGRKLGHILMDTLKQLAIKTGCYKLSLDCEDRMVPYYHKFGFLAVYGRSNAMSIRF